MKLSLDGASLPASPSAIERNNSKYRSGEGDFLDKPISPSK
jgi:hypothetical protein